VYIICVMVIDIACLCDFPIRFHNRSEGIVFLLFLFEWNDMSICGLLLFSELAL
jgi:hypothetical protein